MRRDEALAVAQLSHAGRQTPCAVNPNPFSCSGVQLMVEWRSMGFRKPVTLTKQQIKTEVTDRFVYAAKFAQKQGWFLCCLRRTNVPIFMVDNRMRVITQIIEAIRKEIDASTGFLVEIKNSVGFQKDGLHIDDAKIMCEVMELSGGTMAKLAFQHMRDSTRKREAFFLAFAEKIRPVSKRTVVYVTDGWRTVPAMVRTVVDGTTDDIGFGRL
ncbi:unnamed protein product [Angiostrongylus costaricensis]|uniref:DUF2090 domain-containing protein n=1 Tax=Angiostrongylus costaricensis TaxID=334426 RepID=A0A0R3PI95_ANGCS|nr:unnamed protein product [Angiostrongylus costaricensis]